MIRLTNSNTDLLSLITAQNGAKVVVSYSDATSSAYTGGTDVTSIASATTTTIVATPAASTVRDVDEINIKNTFAGSHTMTVQYSRGGTLYPMFTASLLTDESISYTHGSGWCALDANGNRKEAIGPVPSSSVLGTTTNNSAAAGVLGEYIASVFSTQNYPASGNFGDATSISLTAGDWDVSILARVTATTATVTSTIIGISATSGNSATGLVIGDNRVDVAVPTNVFDSGGAIPTYRVSIASTTTYYYKILGNYTVGTPQIAGRISARRVR